MKSAICFAIVPIFLAISSLILQLPVYQNLGKLYIEFAIVGLIFYKIRRLDLTGPNLLNVFPCLIFIIYTIILFNLTAYDWGISTLLLSIKHWVLLLVLCVSRIDVIDSKRFGHIVSIFIRSLFLIYLLQTALGVQRPSLFFENNFELVLLLFGYLYSEKYRGSLCIDDFLILLLVLFSGSRSILMGYLLLLIYRSTMYSWMLRISGTVLVGMSVISYIIISDHRILSLSDPQDVDRFLFSLLAYREIVESSWEVWLLGKGPFEPVNMEICERLSYYRRFFIDDQLCHSSIFHAQILRTLRDYGLIGLLSSFLLAWVFLRRISNSRLQFTIGFWLILVTSASISGLGNSFLMYVTLLVPIKESDGTLA